MCGKFFGLGIVVFAFTFGLGAFVPEFLTPVDLPSQTSVPAVNSAPAQSLSQTLASEPIDNKNCVPVDGSLRYRTLEYKQLRIVSQPAKKSDLKAEKPEETKSAREKWEKPKSDSRPDESFEYSREDYRQAQDLLHREKCFEASKEK